MFVEQRLQRRQRQTVQGQRGIDHGAGRHERSAGGQLAALAQANAAVEHDRTLEVGAGVRQVQEKIFQVDLDAAGGIIDQRAETPHLHRLDDGGPGLAGRR